MTDMQKACTTTGHALKLKMIYSTCDIDGYPAKRNDSEPNKTAADAYAAARPCQSGPEIAGVLRALLLAVNKTCSARFPVMFVEICAGAYSFCQKAFVLNLAECHVEEEEQEKFHFA